MTKAYTLFDPNWGNIPLAVAIAETPFNPNPLVDATITNPTITSGTMDDTPIGQSTSAKGSFTTSQIGALTATQLTATTATITRAGLTTLQVGSLNATQIVALSTCQIASLTTTQIGTLSATMLLGAGTFTCNGATGVSTQVGGLTSTSVLLFSLKTVGGTVGATPRALFPPNTTSGIVVIAGSASDTSVYNVAAIG